MDFSEVCNIFGDRKKEIDIKLCILCQEKSIRKTLMSVPKVTSFKTLLGRLQQRVVNCKKRTYAKAWESLRPHSPESIRHLKFIYHRECYSKTTNTTLISRLGRTSSSCESTGSENDASALKSKPMTRSSLDGYDKEKCFFVSLTRVTLL